MTWSWAAIALDISNMLSCKERGGGGVRKTRRFALFPPTGTRRKSQNRFRGGGAQSLGTEPPATYRLTAGGGHVIPVGREFNLAVDGGKQGASDGELHGGSSANAKRGKRRFF